MISLSLYCFDLCRYTYSREVPEEVRECKKKWEAIKADIEAAQNAAHDKDADEAAHWGENYDDADDALSPGTKELYTHLTHAHRTRIKQKLLSRQAFLAAEH